jgi:hypothetical protein
MAPKTPAKTPKTVVRKKQYRQIAGVRYDDPALCLADTAVLEHGKITLQAAKEIFEEVEDGPG